MYFFKPYLYKQIRFFRHLNHIYLTVLSSNKLLYIFLKLFESIFDEYCKIFDFIFIVKRKTDIYYVYEMIQMVFFIAKFKAFLNEFFVNLWNNFKAK